MVSDSARLPRYVPATVLARTPGPARLSSVDRRDALLATAAAILTDEPVEAVTMEAVAERAGVSRPLVYKHFANRGDLLAAVYQREAAVLHDELATAVRQAETVTEMFRALIRGALKAQADRGTALAALRGAGGWNLALRQEQRQRDRTTVRYFATRAANELSLREPEATVAVAILLGAIETVLAQWRRRPTRQHATQLEDAYVTLVTGGLAQLARSRPSAARLTGPTEDLTSRDPNHLAVIGTSRAGAPDRRDGHPHGRRARSAAPSGT